MDVEVDGANANVNASVGSEDASAYADIKDTPSLSTPLNDLKLGDDIAKPSAPEVPPSPLVSDAPPVPILGIDFGSSSSVVSSSFLGNTKLPVLVQNNISSVGTPSEVGFRENQRLFGEECATNDPENTIGDLKSLLAAQFQDIQGDLIHYFVPLQKNEKGAVEGKFNYCGESQTFSVEALLAMILRRFVSFSKQSVDKIPFILSVPRSFGNTELSSLRKAAKIANLNLAGFVPDLTAAALVYANTRVQGVDQREVVLFVDMGKVYFQLQLVEFSNNKMRVLSSHSEKLGGRDFTERLRLLLSEEILAKYKIDVSQKPRNLWQMRRESERLKKVLSTVPAVKFEYFIMEHDVVIPVSRPKFEERCADLLERIPAAVQKVIDQGAAVLKEAGVEWNGFSLEIIGGGLIIPAVLQKLKTTAGVPDVRRSLDTQSCRAIGTGLFGALYYREGAGVAGWGEGNSSYVIEDAGIAELNRVEEGQVAESFEKEHELELQMCKRDEEVAALAAKRNQVEERIYILRDKIQSSPEEVGLQSDVAKREKLYEVLKELEDWILYSEEVETATIQVFEEKLASLNASIKDIAPKFHQYLEDMEIERRKMEEKARQDEEERQKQPTRDKLERPLKKSEFIAASEKRKQQGNQAIKEDDFDGAIVRYKQALANFPMIREEFTAEEEVEVKQIKLACYLNLAFCYLKRAGNEAKVIQNCDEALALDANNVKALFRRGSAYLTNKEYEKAKKDFKLALEQDPSNKATQRQLAIAEKKIQEQVQREKNMCAKMFG